LNFSRFLPTRADDYTMWKVTNFVVVSIADDVECADRRQTGACILQSVSERCEGRRRCLFVGNEQDLLPPCSSSSSDQLPSAFSDRLAVTYACCKNRFNQSILILQGVTYHTVCAVITARLNFDDMLTCQSFCFF